MAKSTFAQNPRGQAKGRKSQDKKIAVFTFLILPLLEPQRREEQF